MGQLMKGERSSKRSSHLKMIRMTNSLVFGGDGGWWYFVSGVKIILAYVYNRKQAIGEDKKPLLIALLSNFRPVFFFRSLVNGQQQFGVATLWKFNFWEARGRGSFISSMPFVGGSRWSLTTLQFIRIPKNETNKLVSFRKWETVTHTSLTIVANLCLD